MTGWANLRRGFRLGTRPFRRRFLAHFTQPPADLVEQTLLLIEQLLDGVQTGPQPSCDTRLTMGRTNGTAASRRPKRTKEITRYSTSARRPLPDSRSLDDCPRLR